MDKQNNDEQDQTKIEPTTYAIIGLLVIVITIGTVFYHIVEKFSWIDSFYFSVVSLSTVGYGDLYPVTTEGKLFTSFYVMLGIGIFTFSISYLMKKYAKNKKSSRFNDK